MDRMNEADLKELGEIGTIPHDVCGGELLILRAVVEIQDLWKEKTELSDLYNTAVQNCVDSSKKTTKDYILDELRNEKDRLNKRVAELEEEIEGMGHVNNSNGRWICKFIKYKP